MQEDLFGNFKGTGVDQVTTFVRITTDRREIPVELTGAFGSPVGASCWLLGSGPSLLGVDLGALQRLPVPRMCVNLAGTGLIRPHFWTAYDPSQRFSRSTYLDPGVMKFVQRRRAFDLVPETTCKVCECPNLYFFTGDRHRGFADFVDPAHRTIVDWNDTFVQAIDVLYQLGFRTIYLLGCELQIPPSEGMRDRARARELTCAERPDVGLAELVREWERAGWPLAELETLGSPAQYHFPEYKALKAAAATDFHYFRVCQYLRLSRLAMRQAGLRLVSVMEQSRLNDCCERRTFAEAVAEIEQQVGSPAEEQTTGRYTRRDLGRIPDAAARMKDFQPLHWDQRGQLRGPGGRERSRKSVARDEPRREVDLRVIEEADKRIEPVPLRVYRGQEWNGALEPDRGGAVVDAGDVDVDVCERG